MHNLLVFFFGCICQFLRILYTHTHSHVCMKLHIYIIIITHVHLSCCLYNVCFLIAYACVMCALELMQIFTCIYTYEYPKSRTHTDLVHVQYSRIPLHYELQLKPTEPEVMIALLHACPDTASKPNWVRLMSKYTNT